MAKKKKQTKLGSTSDGAFVYSTNANFAFEGLADLLGESSESPNKATLTVHLEKKHRGGKTAVIIRGFTGPDEDLQELAKRLKTALGVGGTAKDGEIIIQGNHRDKIIDLLNSWAYSTKRVGG